MINNEASEEKKVTANEVLKTNDPTLAGTIAETLGDESLDRFSNDDNQFLKFHGIYQQDDRDLRKTGKKFIMMIRGRIPGGILSPSVYETYDDLATEYGNDTLRVTTRQSFQFHGVVKNGLGPLMKRINEALSSTIAACGDVARNVMAPPTPSTSPLVDRVQEDAKLLSDSLAPITPSYHEIWVEGVRLSLAEKHKDFVDPLYGKTYLPRKFKTGFAIPPLNDIDVFTNCLGFIAIAEGDKLLGYNLLAGGGMGMSHGNAKTFPRIADVIGFLTPDQIEAASKGVLTIHRDFGDRSDRKHARLKYVLEERGAEWFRQELESRIGFKLEDARPYEFTSQGDLYGWHQQTNGNWFLGLHVLAGRIKNADGVNLKTAIRKAVSDFQLESRLTAAQNILLVDIKPENKDTITKIFADNGINVDSQGSTLSRVAMACPALPTCGLALAESERALPGFLGDIENLLEDVSLPNEEIVIRTTGCPNGCARPYMAELGLVGRAPNKYQLYVGGNGTSTRLARLYKENVKTDEVVGTLRPIFERFKAERNEGERFGDFSDRVLLKEAAEN